MTLDTEVDLEPLLQTSQSQPENISLSPEVSPQPEHSDPAEFSIVVTDSDLIEESVDPEETLRAEPTAFSPTTKNGSTANQSNIKKSTANIKNVRENGFKDRSINKARSDNKEKGTGFGAVSMEQLEEYRGIALKLFKEEFLLIHAEEYMLFLASQDQECAIICELYMNLFLWPADLLQATRMLCGRLHLKGESQEIDRVLSAFTRNYLKQHPDNVFCTHDFEKIYIIIYSLILLNTNLHNAEVGKKSKISQMDYIANTLSTFIQQNRNAEALTVKQRIQIERELNMYYEDLAREQLSLKTCESDSNKRLLKATQRLSVADTFLSTGGKTSVDEEQAPVTGNPSVISSFANWPHHADTGRISSGNYSVSDKRAPTQPIKGPPNHTPHLSASLALLRPSGNSSFGFTRALASEVSAHRPSAANSLRAARSNALLGHRSSHASLLTKDLRISADTYDESFSMVSLEDTSAFNVELDLPELNNTFNIDNYQDRVDLKLELQGAPYLKEGLLKLRVLNNDKADSALLGDSVDTSSALEMSIGALRKSVFSSFLRSFSSARTPKQKPATIGTSNSLFQKQTEYFVVVSKGELRLYSFDPKIVKKQQKKQRSLAFEEEEDVGDGNWLKNAANVGNYNLCSTLARLDRLQAQGAVRKHQWTLIFPKVCRKPQKLFLFEAGTPEVAAEFVNTCNFWASKITAVPPLEETVSSIEYGWTDVNSLASSKNGFKKAKSLHKWESIPRGVYFSNLVLPSGNLKEQHEGIMRQFLQTLKYYNHLKSLYNQFLRQKVRFVKMFRQDAGCSNYTLVVRNYELKLQEYKSELTRYKSYIIMLAYGLKLRLDLEDDEDDLMLYAGMDDFEPSALKLEPGVPEVLATEAVPEPSKPGGVSEDSLNDPSKSFSNFGANQVSLSEFEAKPELRTIVIREINKLLITSGELNRLFANDPNCKAKVVGKTNVMIKSPKTFSFANLTDFDSSPIKQLLRIDNKPEQMTQALSSTTIAEEEEPEDQPEEMTDKKPE